MGPWLHACDDQDQDEAHPMEIDGICIRILAAMVSDRQRCVSRKCRFVVWSLAVQADRGVTGVCSSSTKAISVRTPHHASCTGKPGQGNVSPIAHRSSALSSLPQGPAAAQHRSCNARQITSTRTSVRAFVARRPQVASSGFLVDRSRSPSYALFQFLPSPG